MTDDTKTLNPADEQALPASDEAQLESGDDLAQDALSCAS